MAVPSGDIFTLPQTTGEYLAILLSAYCHVTFSVPVVSESGSWMVSFNAMPTAAKLPPLLPVENRYKHGVREIGGAGLPRKIPPKHPSPRHFCIFVFNILPAKYS